jgi:hypothetical protein
MRLVELDSKIPILFFPIRIETRYHYSNEEGSWFLRLRFFPDQILIDNFDPRLTKREISDARNYWKLISESVSADLEQVKISAWRELANKYGLPRSAYITKEVINYTPDLDWDPVNPTLKSDDQIQMREEGQYQSPFSGILPTHFWIYGKFKNDMFPPFLEMVTKDIPKYLPIMDPFQNADPTSNNWLTDFNMALELGMAYEKKITQEQYQNGFEFIIAWGVREDQTPEETRQQIGNLFVSHRYSHGISLLRPGTPTNLTNEKSKDRSHTIFSPQTHPQSDVDKFRALEFSSAEKDTSEVIPNSSPDGIVINRALGLKYLSYGLENANNQDQKSASCMSVVLWPVVAGYFLKSFVHKPSLNIANLKEHFIRFVSAQGSIPPIRIGDMPYGILPVTISSEWEDKSIIENTNDIQSFFTRLKHYWTRFINDVPTVMMKSDQISPTQNLLDILSMGPISHSYYVRGARSLLYLSAFIFDVLRIRKPNGEPAITFGDSSVRDVGLKNKERINRHLASVFRLDPQNSPLYEILKMYEFCLSKGIGKMNFPLVTDYEDSDIWDTTGSNYLEKMYNDLKPNGERNFLKTTKEQIAIPGVAPSLSDPLLLRLLRYSASLLGKTGSDEEIDRFDKSLEHLRREKPSTLERLLLQTLDLTSYRLDAWLSSFANQRLDVLRENTNGLNVGAYGWVENLMPKEFENGESTKNSVREGGYIQAPSYSHAAAAAVLRNGYLTHSDEAEKKDLLKINLSSERTKIALEIISGIQKMPLSELMGYRFERRLHDASIDYLIDEFRKYFPLNEDDFMELLEDGDAGPARERIEPRNLASGLAIYKNWKRLTDSLPSLDIESIRSFMENDLQDGGWKPFYLEVKTKYASGEEGKIKELIGLLRPHLNYLLDQIDSLSDLCLAESVYQAINGNYLRSGAVMDGMSGDGQIPDPEIAKIPMSGPRQTQRVALVIPVEPLENLTLRDVHEDIPWENPRQLAEPQLGKLLESYIGEVSLWIDVKDESNNIISTQKVELTDLGLRALDLVYISHSELEIRLKYYGMTRGYAKFDIRYEANGPSENLETKSYADLELLIKVLRELIAQLKPLDYSGIFSSQGAIQGDVSLGTIKEIFQRYFDLLVFSVKVIEELETVLSDNSGTDISIENKRGALLRAGLFGIEFAIALSSDGKPLASDDELNNRITRTINELRSRLSQYETIPAKLSEWKSRYQNEGELAFLESLANELSGQPQTQTKYRKTLDILIERISIMLGNKSFLIIPPFDNSADLPTTFSSSSTLNKKVLKWMEKAAYVRPKLKMLDDVITYNQVLELANFSFYCDEGKFMKGSDSLSNNNLQSDPISTVLVASSRFGYQEEPSSFPHSKKLAVILIDEWTEKIISKNQDTCIAFHYDGPSAEAPQALLLAVAPNDLQPWNPDTIYQVINETRLMAKIRAIDYRSLKELRQFLPLLVLNSYGEDIYINLLGGPTS